MKNKQSMLIILLSAVISVSVLCGSIYYLSESKLPKEESTSQITAENNIQSAEAKDISNTKDNALDTAPENSNTKTSKEKTGEKKQKVENKKKETSQNTKEDTKDSENKQQNEEKDSSKESEKRTH